MKESLAGALDLSLLFEDEHCFVLNKPCAVHSVSLPEDSKDTLAARLLRVQPQLSDAAEKAGDAGLVQRLDFETSGAVLGAKSRASWTVLHEALAAGKIEKSYVALVDGELLRARAVNNYLGNSNRRAKKVKVFLEKPRDKDRALEARSQFIPLHYFPQLAASLVRVVAPTARRHQVRAHAASIGHPLVGDALYGSTRDLASVGEALEISEGPGFLLHAETLEFPHPVSGKKISLCAPASEMLAALYRLGKISAGGALSRTS